MSKQEVGAQVNWHEIKEDSRVDKLPRWAQDHISLLRMRLTEARKDANEARNFSSAKTDTIADPNGASPINLPAGVRVVFKLDEGRTITARRVGRCVELYSSSADLSDGTLVMLPQSSNTARITTGRF